MSRLMCVIYFSVVAAFTLTVATASVNAQSISSAVAYDDQLLQVLQHALASASTTESVRLESVASRHDGTVVLFGSISDKGDMAEVRDLAAC